MASGVPYCGEAPRPNDLLLAWNFDPIVVVMLCGALAGGVLHPALRRERLRWNAYFGAIALLTVAFVSPLCALSSALFSARVAHHLLLISAAAPLLAIAFPARPRTTGTALTLAVLAQVVAVWFWHAPMPYAFALDSDGLYWVMQASLLGTAVFAWRELLACGRQLRSAIGHVVLISLMGLLGALITFAPVPLYAPHFLTTGLYGLTPLEDQQLAGLIMWVPAFVPNLVAALACLFRLAEAGRPEAAGPA